MKKYLFILMALLAVVACTPNNPDPTPAGPGNQELPDEPLGNPRVTTGDPYNLTDTGVSFVCNYSGAPSTGVKEQGVLYGTQIDNLNRNITRGSNASRSGSFIVQLVGLEAGTKYFYQAYITVWDGTNKKYVDILGIERAFTTLEGGDNPGGGDDPGGGDNPGGGDDPGGDDPGGGDTVEQGLQYLGGYEIPQIALQNSNACNASGNEKYGSTKWFNYKTTNENQMVVTHTFRYDDRNWRNYTCLVDATKKAPLWSAFIMHNGALPDNNIGGRLGSFSSNWDPGIPESWQQESSANGYSRGHLVASNYRQVCPDANKETFYATNQALQQQNGFNGNIWERLEQKVKSTAPTGRDTLYVVVGLLFEDGVPLTYYGSQPCPSHFYKLLMKCSFDTSGAMTAAKGCAYLFENVAHSGNDYDAESGGKPKYRTSIDAIEERTGWNFFVNVPQELQDAAEAKTAAIW